MQHAATCMFRPYRALGLFCGTVPGRCPGLVCARLTVCHLRCATHDLRCVAHGCNGSGSAPTLPLPPRHKNARRDCDVQAFAFAAFGDGDFGVGVSEEGVVYAMGLAAEEEE
jgi:hypothetical protein